MFKDHMVQGKVTPLHTHPDSEESMYVLEGEILLHVAGQEHRIGTGGFLTVPRETPHAFTVMSETARLLCLTTSGSCQAFFWDASEPIGADTSSGVVDFDRIMASAEKNGGTVVLRPPPFAHP